MLDVRIGYTIGEYDVEFKGGKMYIKMKKTGHEDVTGFGDISVDDKTSTFAVKNWVGDESIWPHDHMYGVYKLEDGEQ